MLWAEHVALNTAHERDDVFAEVRPHFTDAELVELTTICGRFAASNRFQDGLHLPIEDHSEIDKIKNTVRADPSRIRAYLEILLSHWPSSFTAPAELAAAAAHGSFPPPGTTWPGFDLTTRGPARVALPDLDGLSGEAGWFAASLPPLLGGRTNAMRVYAHVPYVAKLVLPFITMMQRAGTGSVLPDTLRTMILIRTAQVNRAPYSLAHHLPAGSAAGLTDRQIAALAEDGCARSTGFSPREQAALAWAESLAAAAGRRANEAFDALRGQFTDTEIVEITGLCAVANMMDRIYNALRVPLEEPAVMAGLKRSLRLEPDALRSYITDMVAHWPDTFPTSVD